MLTALLLVTAPALQLPEPAGPAELTRDQALELLHEGFPSREERARLIAEPPTTPSIRALVMAGALAPERVCGLPPLSGPERDRAVDLALEGLLSQDEQLEPELLYERLRGALGERELRLLAVRCRLPAAGEGGDDEDPAVWRRAETALELLQAAPASLAAPVWAELALDPALREDARVELLDRWIPAVGRPALDRALDALLEDGPPALRRRLLGLWLPMMTTADLPRLQRLSGDANRSVADAAFQLWARRETDPARRMEVFREIRRRPSHLRQSALRALAGNGQEPAMAAELIEMLDGPVAEDHGLAERVLPAFLTPAELFRVLAARLPSQEGSESYAAAMVAVARIPVPEARLLASRWLAGGGWEQLAYASAVARELRNSPEVDAFLPRLLETEQVPAEVARPLARGRAGASEIARRYLRRQLAAPERVLQEQAVLALVEAGDRYDLPLLQEVAMEPAYAPGARAAAVEGLAADEAGRAWLLELLAEELPDYEVRAAVVRGLVEHGDAAQRAAALDHAGEAPGFDDEDLRAGLELMVWQVQEGSPRPEEAAALTGRLVELLSSVRPRFRDGLPDPRRAAAAFPRVHGCARALARCLAAGGVMPRLEIEPLHPPALLHAAAILVREAPAPVQGWCRELAQRSELDPSLRLRAQATAVQAALILGARQAVPAIERLLQRPAALREYPWDLAFGLGAEDARTWVLPGDRLREELLLARAHLAGPEEAGRLLRPLLQAYASPSNLTDAGWLLLGADGEAGDPGLAAAFARRAIDWAPLDPRPRRLLSAAAAAAGDAEAAAAAAEDAERLVSRRR